MSDQNSSSGKNQRNKNKENNDRFYDVSFDYQEDNSNNQHSSSESKPTDDKSSQPDYTPGEKAQPEQETKNDKINRSGLFLERSIRRVKDLFDDMDEERPSDFNPYKKDPQEQYKQRHQTNSDDGEEDDPSLKKSTDTPEPNIRENKASPPNGKPEDQSKNKANLPNKKRMKADLPTPEEIAKEKANRHRKRIEELEKLESEQEVENSYNTYSNWTPGSEDQQEEEYNNKSSSNETPSNDLTNDNATQAINLNDEPIDYGEQNDSTRKDEPRYHSPEFKDDFHETVEQDEVANDSDEINKSANTDKFILEDDFSEDRSPKYELTNESFIENSEADFPALPEDDSAVNHDTLTDQPDSTEEPSPKENPVVENNQANQNDTGSSIVPIPAFLPGTGTGTVLADSSSLPEKSTDPEGNQAALNQDDASASTVGPLLASQTEDPHGGDEGIRDDDDVDAENSDEEGPSETTDEDNKYALTGLSTSEKTIFGVNVTFNVIGRLLLYILIILIISGALVGGVGIGYFANLVGNTEPPAPEVMAEQLSQYDQQSTLYYGNGEPIADVRSDVVRTVTSLDAVSDHIVNGFVATEDEYFYEHPGVVPKAVIRAALQVVLTGSGTGGSTITQQLVKQQLLSNDVTFFRKANEMLLALRVEQYFTKDEILTAYLNVSPFGRNNQGENIAGISQAATGIFGVAPDEVSLNQAAFIVGLPQDPYTYTPYDQSGQIRENLQPGIDRMNEVLFRMYREGYITRTEYDEAIQYDITQDFLPADPIEENRQSYLYQAIMNGAIEQIMLLNIEADGLDPQQIWADAEWYNEYYFAAEEELRTGGYKVYSTIDKEVYDQLQVSAQEYQSELGVTYDGVYVDPETGEETYYVEPVQTGMVVIENTTGRVLGFVAGTDYENNQIDHAFQMRRSPGSTIKPMAVYGPAIEHNIVTPATIIPDTAYVYEYPDGSTWEPTNYGNVVSNGTMSARTALVRSDNIPAVRVYEENLRQGVPVIDYLDKMGFNTVDSYTPEDTQNLAFSLGGVTTGPTVFEQTRGFTTFANNGNYVDGYYIERIEDAYGNVIFQQNEEPVEVFSDDTNYLMVDMLRDTMTDGTGRTANENMEVPGDWIAKSGISEHSKDIWFLASTPSITIGSWVGYDSRYDNYVFDVNDGYGRESVRSQIYWARIVNDLYAIRPEIFGTDQTFAQPDSVQSQTILEETGTLPGSIQVNGTTVRLEGPTRDEVFKVSNPAPELRYDFMFQAAEDFQANFWNQQIQEQRQENQSNNNDNDGSNESSNSSNDDSDDNNADETSESESESSSPETESSATE